jgi:hypothetical protein
MMPHVASQRQRHVRRRRCALLLPSYCSCFVCFRPPAVPQIYHPNVDGAGNICLDILKEKWSAAYSVATILLSLQVRRSAEEATIQLSLQCSRSE